MGWCSECGTHEGYLVGLVYCDAGHFLGHAGYDPAGKLKSGRLRELGTGEDDRLRMPLRLLKVACSCGWRSPLLRVGQGVADWNPSCVFASEGFEEAAALLWQDHVRASSKALDGGYSITELLRRCGAFAAAQNSARRRP